MIPCSDSLLTTSQELVADRALLLLCSSTCPTSETPVLCHSSLTTSWPSESPGLFSPSALAVSVPSLHSELNQHCLGFFFSPPSNFISFWFRMSTLGMKIFQSYRSTSGPWVCSHGWLHSCLRVPGCDYPQGQSTVCQGLCPEQPSPG